MNDWPQRLCWRSGLPSTRCRGSFNPGWLVWGPLSTTGTGQSLQTVFARLSPPLILLLFIRERRVYDRGCHVRIKSKPDPALNRASVRTGLIALASEIATAWPTSPDEQAPGLAVGPIYLTVKLTPKTACVSHVASLLEDLINRLLPCSTRPSISWIA